MRFGAWELGLILVIILILFGVGKLPQVMKTLGKGLREFKDGTKGDDQRGDSEGKEAK
jgi:sec-independent protein translocase protein TatA